LDYRLPRRKNLPPTTSLHGPWHPTSRLEYSSPPTMQLTVDPIRSLKQVISGILGTKSTVQKRSLESDDISDSRKRRLSLAVDEVQNALQRLRQVTKSPPADNDETLQNEGISQDARVYRDGRGVKRFRGSNGTYEVADSCASERDGKSPELGMQNEMHSSRENTELDSVEEMSMTSSPKSEIWEDSMDETISSTSALERLTLSDEEEEFYHLDNLGLPFHTTQSFNSSVYLGTPELTVQTIKYPGTYQENTTPETSFTTSGASTGTSTTTNTTATSPTEITSPSPLKHPLLRPRSPDFSPSAPRARINWNMLPAARDTTRFNTHTPLPPSRVLRSTLLPTDLYPSHRPAGEFTPDLRTQRKLNSRRTVKASPFMTPIKIEEMTPPTDSILGFEEAPGRSYKFPSEPFGEFITPKSLGRPDRLAGSSSGSFQRYAGARTARDSLTGDSVSRDSMTGYSIARGSPGFGSVASMLEAVEEDERDRYHAEISSWGDDDIYLPVLKATSTECEKVWDAEILGCDERSRKVRLMRVR